MRFDPEQKGTATKERQQKARPRYGVDIPTNDEIRLMIEHASGRYRPFLITAIFTGLRASELRGLRWDDVDLDKAVIHVRQRADKYHAIGMPKSDAGQRTVPLPPMVVNTLREWKLACPKGRLNLVFPNGEGNIEWHPNIIKRGLHPVQIAAGIVVPTGKTDKDGNSWARSTRACMPCGTGMPHGASTGVQMAALSFPARWFSSAWGTRRSR